METMQLQLKFAKVCKIVIHFLFSLFNLKCIISKIYNLKILNLKCMIE